MYYDTLKYRKKTSGATDICKSGCFSAKKEIGSYGNDNDTDSTMWKQDS